MKRFIFIIGFLSFSAQGIGVLDLLKEQDHSFVLQRKLKKDIGSVSPVLNQSSDFIKAFEGKNFKKALNLWLRSIHKTSFAKSSTGSAFYSYLLFKNGFMVLSLKNLLESSKPDEIHPIVSNLWKVDIEKSHSVWNYFFFPINQKWQRFFPAEVVFKIGSKYPFQLKKDQEYIKSLLALPIPEEVNTFSLKWLFILSLVQQGDMDSATKILAWLISQTKESNKKDMIHLTIGRLLADAEEFPASLYYYGKVKNLSYFWLLAQEEKAWISFNREDYGQAYSLSSVFEYPHFKKTASPSMLFLLALSQLKNCDYKGITRSLRDFKLLFADRAAKLRQTLAEGSYEKLINKLLEFYASENFYYELDDMSVPYHLKKDYFLKNHILLYDYMKKQQLKRTSNFKSLNERENEIVRQLKSKIQKRMRFLLKKETEKISFAKQNLRLVSASALYRIYGFHSLSLKNIEKDQIWRAKVPIYKSYPFLHFPFNPEEIWLDELSNYKSDLLKSCPQGTYVL